MIIYILICSIFIIDRFLKLLVSVNVGYGESIAVLPFFNITHLNNTGIAFSFFTGNNKILLVINLAVILLLVYVLKFNNLKKGSVYIAYGLILGGALSNLWDRFFYGGVIDYIDFKVWPVFNVADAAITIGAMLIVYSMFKDMKTNKNIEETTL